MLRACMARDSYASSVYSNKSSSVEASSFCSRVSPLLEKMSTRRRPRIWWIESLVFLLWTAAIACRGMSSIHSVSLNTNGTLHITNNHSQDAVETIVCRVTHNSTNRSIFFHLNGEQLDGTHRLQIDRTVRVFGYDNCFNPPPSSRDNCAELMLVVRAVPAVNNSRIFCRARSRDTNSNMGKNDSKEIVTIILRDPVTQEIESPSCSPSPSPSSLPSSSSSHPSPAASPLPTSTIVPEVNARSNPILPEGRERFYAVALAAETVILITAIALCLFLVCCLLKKTTKQSFEAHEERSVSPPVLESYSEKATHGPSSTELTSDCDSKEPRYVDSQCIDLQCVDPQCVDPQCITQRVSDV